MYIRPGSSQPNMSKILKYLKCFHPAHFKHFSQLGSGFKHLLYPETWEIYGDVTIDYTEIFYQLGQSTTPTQHVYPKLYKRRFQQPCTL